MTSSRRPPPSTSPTSPSSIHRLGSSLLGLRTRPLQCFQPMLALAIILVVYLSSSFSPKTGSPAGSNATGPGSLEEEVAARTAASCQLSPAGGPLNVFGLPGIVKAPRPTLTGQGKRQTPKKGQVLEHHDARGDILKVTIAEGVTANLMWTRGGTMRSGDLHNCTQYDVILRGRTRLRTKDLHRDNSNNSNKNNGERESVTEYDGHNNFIAIPPRVPHIFEFLEDNVMIEWWDCDFEAWFYKPYRDIINESIEMTGKSSQ